MRWAVFAVLLAGAAQAADPLPFAMGGAFSLQDQFGKTRTQADPDGHAQLLFFGYANCPGICSAALPTMADMTDLLARDEITVTPVMVTIDPARDTLDTMAQPMSDLHPAFIGLTGSHAALQAAWDAFSIEHDLAYVDPDYGPVYSHGSLIYLMDAQGAVLTIIPPVLDPDRAAEIAREYLLPKG